MKTWKRPILAAVCAVAWAGVAGAAEQPSARGMQEMQDNAAQMAQQQQALLQNSSLNLPKVELYMNQQPILIRPGEARTVPITGAVYDHQFNGRILLAPNNDLPIGPQNPACPIFLNGNNPNVAAPVGQNTLTVGLGVFVPPNTPAGNYNCALKYTALHQILLFGEFSVGKGNEVEVPYTVRVRR